MVTTYLYFYKINEEPEKVYLKVEKYAFCVLVLE